jgi:hypothetical protein
VVAFKADVKREQEGSGLCEDKENEIFIVLPVSSAEYLY